MSDQEQCILVFEIMTFFKGLDALYVCDTYDFEACDRPF